MSELYLVRHAQASFGEENYDRLSALGHRQSRWLGEYFRFRNVSFDQVICGDMVRHRETAVGIGEGMGSGPIAIETCPQWNEFDFERLVEIYLSTRPGEIPPDESPRHAWFQVLRKALLAWSEDRLDGELKESWAGFEQRVREALALATAGSERNRKVLVVSSGGPISMALRHVLEAPPGTMVRMNLQTRNSGFSHLFFNERSIELAGFNHVPHLDRPDRGDAVTYY
jgi:broad specificity phosphatase PhoE